MALVAVGPAGCKLGQELPEELARPAASSLEVALAQALERASGAALAEPWVVGLAGSVEEEVVGCSAWVASVGPAVGEEAPVVPVLAVAEASGMVVGCLEEPKSYKLGMEKNFL